MGRVRRLLLLDAEGHRIPSLLPLLPLAGCSIFECVGSWMLLDIQKAHAGQFRAGLVGACSLGGGV